MATVCLTLGLYLLVFFRVFLIEQNDQSVAERGLCKEAEQANPPRSASEGRTYVAQSFDPHFSIHLVKGKRMMHYKLRIAKLDIETDAVTLGYYKKL